MHALSKKLTRSYSVQSAKGFNKPSICASDFLGYLSRPVEEHEETDTILGLVSYFEIAAKLSKIIIQSPVYI